MLKRDSKIEGDVGNVIDAAASGITFSADAALNQSAFDQNITQGANIQFNSMTIQAAGDNLDDDGRYTLVLRSIRAASSRADRLFQIISFPSLQLPTRSWRPRLA